MCVCVCVCVNGCFYIVVARSTQKNVLIVLLLLRYDY